MTTADTTNANPQERTEEESIYGAGAITSGDLSDHDKAMIGKSDGLEVRDGDDLIEIELPTDGNTEGDQEDATDDDQDQKDETKKDDKPALEGDAKIEADLNNSTQALENIGKTLSEKGVDVAAIEAEVVENGKLSDATYETLEKNGYPRAVADAILSGVVQSQQAMAQSILATAGGPEGFNTLTDFAHANSPETVVAYNAAVARNDITTAKALLEGIKAARTAKLGTATKQIQGRPAAPSKAVEGFASRAEMTAAMKDPRYSKDATYRASVEKRVVASTF